MKERGSTSSFSPRTSHRHRRGGPSSSPLQYVYRPRLLCPASPSGARLSRQVMRKQKRTQPWLSAPQNSARGLLGPRALSPKLHLSKPRRPAKVLLPFAPAQIISFPPTTPQLARTAARERIPSPGSISQRNPRGRLSYVHRSPSPHGSAIRSVTLKVSGCAKITCHTPRVPSRAPRRRL